MSVEVFPEPMMTSEKAAALRKPFPKSAIGKLPKAGLQLDYVGHAAVVDRLLAVDPNWSWEPFAVDERGLPALDSKGNLWIRMTVCGVTRIGVGDGPNAKQIISDALRNAAMRFGVALDLWSKEELESAHAAPSAAPFGDLPRADTAPAPVLEEPPDDIPGQEALPVEDPPDPKPRKKPAKATAKQVARIGMLASDLGLDRDAKLAGVAATIGHEVTTTKELTPAEASAVLESMQASLDARAAK